MTTPENEAQGLDEKTLDAMIAEYEKERHQYIGNIIYHENNQACFRSGMRKAVAVYAQQGKQETAPDRAEALTAFKEYMAQTGLTPQDEQKRRYENIWKHKATIEYALSAPQEVNEGEYIRFNDGPDKRYVDTTSQKELDEQEARRAAKIADEWDYLLGEISTQKVFLHDGTLDILNRFIRQSLARPAPQGRMVDVEENRIIAALRYVDGHYSEPSTMQEMAKIRIAFRYLAANYTIAKKD